MVRKKPDEHRTSELLQEYRPTENEIESEKEFICKENVIEDADVMALEMEQRELGAIMDEFFKNESLCDQFEQGPTPELCGHFLKGMSVMLEKAEHDSESANNALSWTGFTLKYLQKAQMVHNGIKGACG